MCGGDEWMDITMTADLWNLFGFCVLIFFLLELRTNAAQRSAHWRRPATWTKQQQKYGERGRQRKKKHSFALVKPSNAPSIWMNYDVLLRNVSLSLCVTVSIFYFIVVFFFFFVVRCVCLCRVSTFGWALWGFSGHILCVCALLWSRAPHTFVVSPWFFFSVFFCCGLVHAISISYTESTH